LLDKEHVASAAELYFRVSIWLQAQRNPTAIGIRREFGVHRSTAYRWLSAYRAAKGAA